MRKYEIVIFWSDEDAVFIAEVGELAGCLAHGATKAEALKNVDEAIELWLATAREFGDPIPEPKQHLLAA